MVLSLILAAVSVPLFEYSTYPDGKVRVNYDEARVEPYTLEDPLTFANGRKVSSSADWRERREEILGIFAREMYGQPPPPPEAVVTELADERVSVGGYAIRRLYRMWFRHDRSGPCVNWIVWIPRHAVKPVPVVSFLNYHGNHSLTPDPDIPLMKAWKRVGKAEQLRILSDEENESWRGFSQNPNGNSILPLGQLMARGYAVMSACYCEVSPDPRHKEENPAHRQDPFAYTGVFELWGPRDPARTDDVTSLGAWAWALSRGLDLAERIPEIDTKKSLVTGCSRLAKAALIAAARDERFAVCAPVQTGGGGCPLAKRDFGENPGTETRMFSHWYCKAYSAYRDEPWRQLTFDQHLFLATIAPRALIVHGFDNVWFDTKGEYLAVRAASPVWTFLGKEGLPDVGFPCDYDISAVGHDLGYVRRTEGHGISGYDWQWMLDFADVRFGRLKAFPQQPVGHEDFQSAIDAASAAGGGRVVVPPGRHLTKGLMLKSNVELHLAKGAVLEGSPRTNDYPVVVLPHSEGNWMAVVMAVGATNVAVTGEGEIFGNGSVFPRGDWYPNQEGDRPRGLFFGNCRNVRLEGFTLRDAACWGCVVQGCEQVEIRRLKIDSHCNHNNDGIDIEAKDVVIADCDVDAGDDAICLKSNDPDFVVENVLVTNCIVRSHCVPLKIGTATHGVVRNVTFAQCRIEAPRRCFSPSTNPLRFEPYFLDRARCDLFPGATCGEPAALSALAVECADGGAVTDIVFRDIVIDGGCYVPIFVRACERLRRWNGTPRGNLNVLRNVHFENVTGHSLSAVPSSVTGIPGFRVQDVCFRNVHLVGRGGGENADERNRPVPELEHKTPEAKNFGQALPACGLWVRHVDGLRLIDTDFSLQEGMSDRREKVVCDDCSDDIRKDETK